MTDLCRSVHLRAASTELQVHVCPREIVAPSWRVGVVLAPWWKYMLQLGPGQDLPLPSAPRTFSPLGALSPSGLSAQQQRVALPRFSGGLASACVRLQIQGQHCRRSKDVGRTRPRPNNGVARNWANALAAVGLWRTGINIGAKGCGVGTAAG